MTQNPEKLTPPELRPAEKESIAEFLRNVELITTGSQLNPKTGSEGRGFTLPDGRMASAYREGLVGEDLHPKDPIASVFVYEMDGDQRKTVGYLLYAGEQMEKIVSIESMEQMKKEYSGFDSDENPSVSILRVEKDVRRHKEMIQAIKEERALGLRTATEADMQETRELFAQLDELAQKEELK